MKEFYSVRLQYYDMRKVNLAKKLTEEWEKLDNKMRFILAVIQDDLVVSNRKKHDLMMDLKKQGFKTFYETEKKEVDKEADDASVADNENDDEVSALDRGYDYLLSMKIWSLTMERVQDLTNQRKAKRTELESLLATPAETLWLNDLAALELALDDFEAAVDEEKMQEVLARKKAVANAKRAKGGKSAASKKKSSKKHGSDSESDEEEDAESDFEEKPRKAAPAKKAAVAKPAPIAGAVAAVSAAAPAKVQSTLIKFMTNTTAAPAAAKATAIAKKPAALTAAAVQERREEDVRENMTLAERIAAARAATAAPKPVAAPVPVAASASAAASKPKATKAPKAAAAPKKKATKVQDLCSDAESEDEEEADSEDDIFRDRSAFASTITATRAPRAVAQKKITYAVDSDLEDSAVMDEDDEAEFDENSVGESDDDSEAFEDSEDDAPKKSKAKKAAPAAASKPVPKATVSKAAAKPIAAKKAAIVPAIDVSRPMVIASPPAKVAPAAKGVKRSSKSAVDSLLSVAREVYSPGVASPVVVKKARAAVAKVPKAAKAAPAPKAAPAAAKKAPAAKKSSKKNTSDDEEEEFDEEVVRVSRSPKPMRARKTLKYVDESEEEEDDFIDDSEADEESDFSDDE